MKSNRSFEVFGKGVVILITAGLAAAVIEALTGFVVIPGMAPFSDGVATVGHIAILVTKNMAEPQASLKAKHA
ncbi:ethanolamine utilization protein EutH [Endozoicomonas sp. ALB091]|uniref:ethanolamine utilization protein EutH n=1 Tax=Endozoicomonas sp. ALB091 TaxID=3403073 RepID=UPI003BB7C7B9